MILLIIAILAPISAGASTRESIPECGDWPSYTGGPGQHLIPDESTTYDSKGRAVFDGTNGNDYVWVDDDAGVATVVNLKGGDDFFCGSSMNDVVNGGAGDDSLYGNGGNDKLNGKGGDDVLHGGMGDDAIKGGSGADSMSGADGCDDPGDGDDTLKGGKGADWMCGASGDDKLVGGPGDDGLTGGSGDDDLNGGGGYDVCDGETARACEGGPFATDLEVASGAFSDGGMIPDVFTCDGLDVSPPLIITGMPIDTETLTVIMDDADAPGGIWVHWVAYDISPVTAIAQGNDMIGTSGRNSWNDLGYDGPCPPGGTHRYYINVYAVDKTLGLAEGASKQQVLDAMSGHILDQARLMGRYSAS